MVVNASYLESEHGNTPFFFYFLAKVDLNILGANVLIVASPFFMIVKLVCRHARGLNISRQWLNEQTIGNPLIDTVLIISSLLSCLHVISRFILNCNGYLIPPFLFISYD